MAWANATEERENAEKALEEAEGAVKNGGGKAKAKVRRQQDMYDGVAVGLLSDERRGTHTVPPWWRET